MMETHYTCDNCRDNVDWVSFSLSIGLGIATIAIHKNFKGCKSFDMKYKLL